jgi:ABC-type transport system involved in multi-copper enzyme maturation permease subunit
MDTLRAVFSYTFKEHLRHRVWASSALVGLVLGAGAVAVSALGHAERGRLLLDLGLAANETVGLAMAVFLSVHLVLQEIETRAVYLILSRPVPRWQYLLGRFLGTVGAVALGMAAMGLLHLALLALFDGVPAGRYALAWSCSLGKVAVMSALALLLSLSLTSEAAAMSFSLFFWALGHFSAEMRFLADRSGSAFMKTALTAFSHAAPDFGHFNYRDLWHGAAPGGDWAAWAALYALAYCAACLALAAQVFEQKEF